MTIFIFANDAQSSLGAPVLSTDTTITLITGGGLVFPAPTTGQILSLTLVSLTSSALVEVIYCTSISGDILTVMRGQEGTLANNWNMGDLVQNLFTAGTLNNFAQISSGTTSQRPIPTKIGQPYFDTTLNYQINCSQITPSIIWRNGAGDMV